MDRQEAHTLFRGRNWPGVCHNFTVPLGHLV